MVLVLYISRNYRVIIVDKSGLVTDQKEALISFIHQWLYSHLLGLGIFFSFVIIFTQTIGLLGRVISPSQGRYVHTQHKQNKRT
jgi:hypothetical protein